MSDDDKATELAKWAESWKSKTKAELHREGFSVAQTVRMHRATDAAEVMRIQQEPRNRPARLR